jgi:hypothetical protein
VDQAEVQRLVDALRNYIKKPEPKRMRAAHRRTWIVIAIIAGLLGGIATYEYLFYLTSSSLFALIMAVCCALLIFAIVYGVYTVEYLPYIGKGRSVICLSFYREVPSVRDLLIPLYAVMILYGQDPAKIKIEGCEPSPYYGRFLNLHIVLPLDGSTAEVWKGRIDFDVLIIIEGSEYIRNDILRAIKYYLYDKYMYAEGYNYSLGTSCLFGAEGAINLEMWLCKNRDKIPQWIAQGKKIKVPEVDVYYGY